MSNEIKKPVMKFVARLISGRMYLKPACDKSLALSRLISKHPRSTLEPIELPILADMGFDVEVTGDMKEFRAEVKRVREIKG